MDPKTKASDEADEPAFACGATAPWTNSLLWSISTGNRLLGIGEGYKGIFVVLCV